MKKNNKIAIFEGQKIRRIWDKEKELWYFSVVDVVEILTGSTIPKRYWSDLKIKLAKEGSQVYEKIVQLKFLANDGKYYLSDASDAETMFRLIQSIPSPKAEPFKRWLARVGYERIQEIADPERSISRARENWKRGGRSEEWIQRRMFGQETRNKLTDYWSEHEIKEKEEFAILTNIIHQEWSDLTVKDHKKLKGLKTQNLRDHMSEAELIFTALAEMSTRQIAETMMAKGFEKNKIPAKKGGKIAGEAREKLEKETGKKIISRNNFLAKKNLKKLK
jgi:hypothetical protein